MCLRRKKVTPVTIPDVLEAQQALERAMRVHEETLAARSRVKATASDVKKLRQQNGIGEALDAIFRKDHPQ